VYCGLGGGVEMGVLVSCCLRLMGYENLTGAAAQASQRNVSLSAKLAERDNPNVDGRKRPMISRYTRQNLAKNVSPVPTYCAVVRSSCATLTLTLNVTFDLLNRN